MAKIKWRCKLSAHLVFYLNFISGLKI